MYFMFTVVNGALTPDLMVFNKLLLLSYIIIIIYYYYHILLLSYRRVTRSCAYFRETQHPDFSTYVSLVLHVAQLQLKEGALQGELMLNYKV